MNLINQPQIPIVLLIHQTCLIHILFDMCATMYLQKLKYAPDILIKYQVILEASYDDVNLFAQP